MEIRKRHTGTYQQHLPVSYLVRVRVPNLERYRTAEKCAIYRTRNRTTAPTHGKSIWLYSYELPLYHFEDS
eukprot:scaffold111252_cov13-Prasinocladus_malaysianus.AAC.1